MSNRNDIKLVFYRKLRRGRLAQLLVSVAALTFIVVFGLIHLIMGISPEVWEWWMLGTSEVLFLAGVLGFVYTNNKMIQISTQMKAVNDFFSEPVYLYPENMFVKAVHKFSRVKRGYHTGTLIAINVKDLHSDILNFYGSDEVKAINYIVFTALINHFHDLKKYRYGFSYLDSFLLYKKTNDPENFYAELDPFVEEVNRRISERAKIPSITLLFGSYTLGKKDDIREAVEKAVLASRYNDNTRFSNTVVPFSQDQVDVDTNEKSLPFEIMKGMKEDQFQIYYQPKFNLHTNRFYGAEALVRWSHPTRGLLPPSFFVPFSERSGLIVGLDHYIYEHVLLDMKKWAKEKKRLVKVSINISRKTVYDDGLIVFLSDKLKENGIDPKLLDMELTESLAARDTAFLLQLVNKIKALRMNTSIDDFGVGYSSFNSLKKLPFDTLKIDKSFIDDIEVDQKSRDIVKAIINLSHALGIWTIAEGVETREQVEILKYLGLDSIQGYYYSRPLNNYEFQKFLADNPFERKEEEQ